MVVHISQSKPTEYVRTYDITTSDLRSLFGRSEHKFGRVLGVPLLPMPVEPVGPVGPVEHHHVSRFRT